jgi:uncharacterized protein
VNAGRRIYAKFATAACYYIYDTSTNQILRVSKELWEAIDSYLAKRDERNDVGTTQPVVVRTPIEQEIEDGLAQGFLGWCDVRSMGFYDDESQLREAIARKLPQLTLELTQACNARCHYCPYTYDSARRSTPRCMSWSTLRNAVATFMSHSVDQRRRSISFWGGEPLLAFRLMRRAILYVAATYPGASVTYQFTTNGTLLNEDAIAFFVNHDCVIVVSLDGPAPIHDRHRLDYRQNGTFERVIAALRRIRRNSEEYYRTRVRFACVITPQTDLPSLSAFFRDEELCRGHPVTMNVVGATPAFTGQYGAFTADDKQRLRMQMLKEILADNGRPSTPLGIAGVKALLPIAMRSRCVLGSAVSPNGCCVPLLKKMHVSVSGDIYLCERMDYDNRVGNVNEGGIDLGAVMNLVREYCDHSIEDCRSCWAVRLCHACYRDFICGNRWSGDDRVKACANSRRRTLEALTDYAAVIEVNPQAFDDVFGM